MTPEKTYCYSYQRISSKQQRLGDGINRQLRESKKFCEQKGWTLDTSFNLTDIGKSAYHGHNLDDTAQLGIFLNAVKEGLIRTPAVLLVENLDRLSRANISDALQLFLSIINSNVSICTYADGMLYTKESIRDNPSGLMLSISIMFRGHEESEIKSRRIKSVWKKKLENLKAGKIQHKSLAPKWITIEDGTPVINEEEANIVRLIFSLCIDQNMSYAGIIRYLRDVHKPSVEVCGKYLSRLFKEPRVLGYYIPKIRENPDNDRIKAYPAIISEKTFYEAQAKINSRRNLLSGKPSSKQVNLFRGLLRCGECGGPYIMSRSGTKTVYRCKEKYQSKNGCQQRSVLAPKFRDILMHMVSVIDSSDMLEAKASKQKIQLAKQVEIKNAELQDKKSRITNLAELLETGSKIALSRITALEQEVETIETIIDQLTAQIEDLSSSLLSKSMTTVNYFHQKFATDSLSDEDYFPFNEALSTIIKEIEVFKLSEDKQIIQVKIHLKTETDISAVVYKKYKAEIFRNNVFASRVTATE